MKDEIDNENVNVIKPTVKRLNDSKMTEIIHGFLTVIITHDQYIEAYKNIADIYRTITHNNLVSAGQMLSKRLRQVVNSGNENNQNSNCK